MKKRNVKPLSLLLAFALVFTMAGATASVSYAEMPLVWDYCGPMWIWPGSGASAWIRTTQSVTSVTLQVEDGSLWLDCAECTSKDDRNDYWYTSVFSTSEDEGNYWYYRFKIVYPGSAEPVYYPENGFRVECTSAVGGERIYGPNRYDTALKAAQVFTPWPAVVIACGTNFADALGGTYLATKYEAPILLVNNTSAVMDDIAGQIGENIAEDGRVFILGGTGAVSEYMEAALAEQGIQADKITRFAGKNRYDTNLQVLKYCMISSEELMVCCGTEFADALSASALGYPVVLVGKTLTDDQKEYFKTLSPYYVNMVGGTGAVPQVIEDWFEENSFHIWRYAGKNRYETSYMLALDYFLQQSYYVFFAYARNFPDGLAAGPLAYRVGAPLLLIDDGHYLDAERFIIFNDCRYAIVMGGPALIADYTIERIMYSYDLTDGGHAGAPGALRAAAAAGRAPFSEEYPVWSKYH
ncbi:MAG: cell wall-binding repeat-containing protein [Clostridia bacterium]|nr:cell wall-binding repeat-containing protein [Clostridia bacterium]